jgi:hypothetical protein
MIEELIDHQTEWRNQTLLTSLFTEEEKLTINTIPISLTNQLDRQVWRCMAMGIFLVKSAYHFAKDMNAANNWKDLVE